MRTKKHVIYLDHPEQLIRVGVDLSKETKTKLIAFLKPFSNVFTWQSADMTGVDHRVIEHSLDIMPRSILIKKKRGGNWAIGTKKSMKKSQRW